MNPLKKYSSISELTIIVYTAARIISLLLNIILLLKSELIASISNNDFNAKDAAEMITKTKTDHKRIFFCSDFLIPIEILDFNR